MIKDHNKYYWGTPGGAVSQEQLLASLNKSPIALSLWPWLPSITSLYTQSQYTNLLALVQVPINLPLANNMAKNKY